jgi:DNA-binding MarR family transcriptional regulator
MDCADESFAPERAAAGDQAGAPEADVELVGEGPAREPELTLGRRLYLAHRAQHDLLDARFGEHGASIWNWVLLRSAAELDGGSQRELAEHMGIEPPTLVGQLDRLVADGYVERRRDERDRRVVRVVPTPAGRARLAELHEVALELDGELRALLTEAEAEVLAGALGRIHEQLTHVKQEEDRHGRRA